jgi:ankyrin repeat protein
VDVDPDETAQSRYSALHYGADLGMPELVAALLRGDCDTELQTEDIVVPFGAPVPGGRTPLHLAAAQGHTAIVEQLCAAGAALEAADKDANTPYLLACMNNRPAVAALLGARQGTSDRGFGGT